VTAKQNNQKTPEKQTALEIRGLGRIFYSDLGSKVRALQNIDLTVHSGEFLTLVGATGCGKTTLLNLIAGLDTPNEGVIRLSDNLKFGENIAYVFQHYTLFPWLTVMGNVGFALEMRGIPRRKRKQRTIELLSKVGLSTRSELQQMITELWQENHATIIFVTHNIDEAIVLGDRVLVLSERPGRIAREFKIDLPRPRNRMAKEFTNLFIEIRTVLSGQLD